MKPTLDQRGDRLPNFKPLKFNAHTFKMIAAAILSAAMLGAFQAHAADQHCDPAIKADIINQGLQKYNEHTRKIDGNWQPPNSFDDMYCGLSINASFDSIANAGGIGSLLNGINNAIKNQLSQVCQATITLEPFNLSDSNKSNSCTPINNMYAYLLVIQKYDPKFFVQVMATMSSDYCNTIDLVTLWFNRNPQYIPLVQTMVTQ